MTDQEACDFVLKRHQLALAAAAAGNPVFGMIPNILSHSITTTTV
jgi:hypothetical protein